MSQRTTFILTEQMVDELIINASSSPLRRARINFHTYDADKVQEMLIAAFSDTHIDIHFHEDKSESFCVLRGALRILLFEDAENIPSRTITLSSDLGKNFYRLNAPIPHLVVPLSDPTIFVETTCGPFERGRNSKVPTWARASLVKKLKETYGKDI